MKKLCKGKYKVKNWSEYNKSLKNREDITFWLLEDALENLGNQRYSYTDKRKADKIFKNSSRNNIYLKANIQFTLTTS